MSEKGQRSSYFKGLPQATCRFSFQFHRRRRYDDSVTTVVTGRFRGVGI